MFSECFYDLVTESKFLINQVCEKITMFNKFHVFSRKHHDCQDVYRPISPPNALSFRNLHNNINPNFHLFSNGYSCQFTICHTISTSCLLGDLHSIFRAILRCFHYFCPTCSSWIPRLKHPPQIHTR